jgi:hypothetical protein
MLENMRAASTTCLDDLWQIDHNPAHLTSTQKSKCGGGCESPKVPYTPMIILLKEREMMMLALLCYRKKENR